MADAQAQTGWLIDEIEVHEALTDVLDSACRVPAEHRTAALRWLDEAIRAAGGDPGRLWEANGHDLAELDPLLLLVRSRQLLAEGDAWARAGKCPFWLRPDPDFRGRQGYADSWVAAAETGGRFYVQWEGGEPGFGGGLWLLGLRLDRKEMGRSEQAQGNPKRDGNVHRSEVGVNHV